MKKSFWKFMTVVGFILALVAAGFLVWRFQSLFPNISTTPQGDVLSTQSQMTTTQTGSMETQQNNLKFQERDREVLNRLQQVCFSANGCVNALPGSPASSNNSTPALKYIEAKKAKFMNPDDLVIGTAFDRWEKEDDPVRAFPIKILNWHQVVNAYLNETSIVVTYSPLTMAPRVYQSFYGDPGFGYPILGVFSVSNMVYNGNLVMYDQETKSLWNQFDGKGLTGLRRDETLRPYPYELTTWKEWVKKYPSTEVLSVDTGFDVDYEKYPYGEYQTSDDLYSSVEHQDGRLKKKELVYGVVLGGKVKLYPKNAIEKVLQERKDPLPDELGGHKVLLSLEGSRFKVVDALSKAEVPAEQAFYFAWKAFYPDCEIFKTLGQ